MKWLLPFLLLAGTATAHLEPAEVATSPDGKTSLRAFEAFGDYALDHHWSRTLQPFEKAAVSNSGQVVLLRGRELEVLDERGRHQRSLHVPLLGRGVRSLWLHDAQAYLELADGDLLQTDLLHDPTPVPSVEAPIRRCPDPQTAQRLSAMHHLDLPAPQPDPQDRDWWPKKQGKNYRFALGDEMTVPIIRGILQEDDFLPLLDRPPGYERATAIRVLQDLRSRKALPKLRQLAEKDPEAVQALAAILQEEAAPELHRYAGTAPEVVSAFYEQVPYPPAVPALLNLLPTSRAALARQLRVDLGPDLPAWQHYCTTRNRSGDSSDLLWQARFSRDPLFQTRPRLVAMLPPRGATPFRLDERSLWLLEGHDDPPEIAWDLHTGEPTARLDAQEWKGSENNRTLVTMGGGRAQFRYQGQEWQEEGWVRELSPDGDWAVFWDRLENLPTRQSQPLPQGNYHFFQRQLLGPRLYNLGQLPAVPGAKLPVEDPLALHGNTLVGWSDVLTSVDLPTGKRRKLSDYTQQFALSPSGKAVAHVDKTFPHHNLGDGPLKVTDTTTAAQINPEGMLGTGVLAWSQDEHLLAAADSGGLAVYRDFQPVCSLRMPAARVRTLAFSPDGHYLAAGMDDAIRVWRLGAPRWAPGNLDLQLTSELWTGMRLEGGAARLLSLEEWQARLDRWRRTQGFSWWEGPGPRPLNRPLLALVAGASGLVILVTILVVLKRR